MKSNLFSDKIAERSNDSTEEIYNFFTYFDLIQLKSLQFTHALGMAGLPTVRKVLWCISLEAGGLMIGWFNLMLSFLVLFGMIPALVLTLTGYETVEVNQPELVGASFTGKRKNAE